jgi:2-haloacid dehalogenase
MRRSGIQRLRDCSNRISAPTACKPDPRAYQMGVDAFGMAKEEIAFAAFAGWDAAGAKRFGYPTFWVNRANAPLEELGVAPDGTGTGLADLAAFVGA